MNQNDLHPYLLSQVEQYQTSPLPYFDVNAEEGSIYFMLKNLNGTQYEGGRYCGKLEYGNQSEYPTSPPNIQFHTPNGRFSHIQPIQVFNEDYKWDPTLNLTQILALILSAFLDESFQVVGNIVSTIDTKRKLAKTSYLINKVVPYCHSFYENDKKPPAVRNIVDGKLRSSVDFFGELDPSSSESVEGTDFPLPELPSDGIPFTDFSYRDLIDRDEEETELLERFLLTVTRNTISKICGVDREEVVLPQFKIVEGGQSCVMVDSVLFIKLSCNFSHNPYLQSEFWKDLSHDQMKESVNRLVVEILDAIMYFGSVNDIRFITNILNLSNTNCSMRCVFGGHIDADRPISRENEIEILDLSSTLTSARSLLSVHRMINLRVIYLDHCNDIQNAGKKIFNLLCKKPPIPNLEMFSAVGTSSGLSHKWLRDLGASCPKLNEVFYTRRRGDKVIGMRDAVLDQTMRNPQLLPCGHIADRKVCLNIGNCSVDKIKFDTVDLKTLTPSISHLYLEDGGWKVEIVDCLRETLSSKSFYHLECGTFYNDTSLNKLWGIDPKHITFDELFDFVKEKECIFCHIPMMHGTRISFPPINDPEDGSIFMNGQSLEDIANYIADT
eukprot:TRINITY_DN2588_c0_g1_i1.p1 TRINITY_DN2588_c0_g1~~TRINITY_DN2588_c0_g1_i1.p1  ORF type:complete len:611 (+),score=123.96 TRINITY_DN2588_c0_g1_i1:11-1843(+)